MKILVVNKFFYLKGGAEKAFFENANLFKSKGHEALFFSMDHPKNFSSPYSKYFINNINYEKEDLKNKINVSLKLLYSLEVKRKIESLIKDERPDIAHLHNIYHQISPSILHSLKKFNIPIVMTLHDYKIVCASYLMLADGKICEACKNRKYYHCLLRTCVKNSKMKSLLNTIEMYLHHNVLGIYNLVDMFITPSNFLKKKLEEMGFKGKIAYLPNFVRVEKFRPRFDWQDKVIVYFGRLSREKGLFTLIKAMEGIPNALLKIIGKGPLEYNLKLEVEKQVLKNVFFLGYRNGEELNNEIRNSMCIIMPSECYENNPYSVIEGFALGKPVIGTRIGGIPELVKNKETGLLFEPGNAEDLKNKIAQLLKNPGEILRMGRNARRFVEEELNEEIHYKRLMDIYEMVLNKA